jgi:hypothetical protein
MLAFVLLLGVELWLRASEHVWASVPHSDVGIVDALEQEVIAPASAPSILVLGNSRARDAVAPRQLEKALGVPRGSVMNLALTRGTAFDAAGLLERNASAFSQVDLILFNVDLIQLDGSLEPNERVRRFADLEQRLHEFPIDRTLDLVAGWIWRTYDARDAIRRTLKAAAIGAPPGVPIAEDGRVRWRDDAMNRRSHRISMRRYARSHLRNFIVEPRAVEQLATFVEAQRALGREVVLFEVPFRDEFVTAARREHGAAWAAYIHALDEIAADLGLWRWPSARNAGLRAAQYHDYGHLRDPGARRFTAALAGRIASGTEQGRTVSRKPRTAGG